MSVASIEDRLVRSPVRAEVLGVDFLEAVVRPAGRPVENALADLSDLASRRFVSVVCVMREGIFDRSAPGKAAPADRVGRIEPAGIERPAGTASGDGSPERLAPPAVRLVDATLLSNRHGGSVTCRLKVDGPAARLVQEERAGPA